MALRTIPVATSARMALQRSMIISPGDMSFHLLRPVMFEHRGKGFMPRSSQTTLGSIDYHPCNCPKQVCLPTPKRQFFTRYHFPELANIAYSFSLYIVLRRISMIMAISGILAPAKPYSLETGA